MKIEWLGHSCFYLTADSGEKILIDPYDGERQSRLVRADVVVSSHSHWDHNAIGRCESYKLHINQSGRYEYGGVRFNEIPCYHDNKKGALRGNNLITVIEADGMRLCHFGDLGESVNAELVKKIGKIDVAMICVGGIYTINAAEAYDYIAEIKPKITIPMHYQYNDWFTDVDKVDKFVELWHNNIEKQKKNAIEFNPNTLPKENTLIVLQSE